MLCFHPVQVYLCVLLTNESFYLYVITDVLYGPVCAEENIQQKQKDRVGESESVCRYIAVFCYCLVVAHYSNTIHDSIVCIYGGCTLFWGKLQGDLPYSYFPISSDGLYVYLLTDSLCLRSRVPWPGLGFAISSFFFHYK